jgi:uncharacterized protein involved in response to NO
MNHLKSIEPYRLLFPLGLVFGILGASVWIAFALIPQMTYPMRLHSQLMMGTFLFAFVSGFLMTAIPKMTASFPAQPFELVVAFFLVLCNAMGAYSGIAELFYLISAISILSLIVFFIRRFLARTKSIPPFFPFVLVGLTSGMCGAVILALPALLEVANGFLLFGKRLYFDGMILFLILGIGSRLIPLISGRKVQEDLSVRVIARNLLLCTLLILGFALESAGSVWIGGILKVTVVGWVAFRGWGILAKAQTKSRLALGLRLSGLMVLGGLVMAVLQPGYAVHWMHLTYIAGFGLMTLTVATRVTLAHGSYDLSFEAKSKSLLVCGALILIATATRVSAPFLGTLYTKHLMYAGIVWILAMAIWGFVFIRRMIFKGKAQRGC